jgi:FkbM family methyltransferase
MMVDSIWDFLLKNKKKWLKMSINWIYKYNEHSKEDNIKEFIDEIPKGIFYDLGANLGYFSLYACSVGHQVYAFEVDENNFEGLKANSEANPTFEVKIFNKGIADTKRKVILRTRGNSIGSHHKTLELDDFASIQTIVSYNHTKEIEVDSLDNFIVENNLPWPEYLKVDIDGSEHSFLKGSPLTLNKAKGMVIELVKESEFYQKCVDILHDHGFILTKTYEIPGWPEGKNYVYLKQE